MQGLLLRLAALDAAAENAVRVISFFDALADTVPDIETLLSHAAIMSDLVVGVHDDNHHLDLVASPQEAIRVAAPSVHPLQCRVDSSHQVWIKREGAPHPLDEIVLERLALTCAAVLRRVGRPKDTTFDDPALLELAISPSAPAVDRSRALHLLGSSPSAQIVAIAAQGPNAEITAATDLLRKSGVWIRHAILDDVWLIVTAAEAANTLSTGPGTRAGIGPIRPAMAAPDSWQQALRALRFAERGAYRAIFADSLGTFGFLAGQLRSVDIVGVPDIDVLEGLYAARGGPDLLNTLEVLVMAGSMREAARQLHLHHNSVAARVAKAEDALGFRINEPRGLVRVALALALRQLARHDA